MSPSADPNRRGGGVGRGRRWELGLAPFISPALTPDRREPRHGGEEGSSLRILFQG